MTFRSRRILRRAGFPLRAVSLGSVPQVDIILAVYRSPHHQPWSAVRVGRNDCPMSKAISIPWYT